jgi:hypothetical protein
MEEKQHIEIEEGWHIFDNDRYCNDDNITCIHLYLGKRCTLFGELLGVGHKPNTAFKCSKCDGSWKAANRKREIENKISNTPTYQQKEMKRCLYFLRINGWEQDKTDEPLEFATFNKEGCISIDINDSEMVFLGETGDFLHRPIDYFTLIGVLISYRQLAINFIPTETG